MDKPKERKGKAKDLSQVKADEVDQTLATLDKMLESALKLQTKMTKATKKRKPRGMRVTMIRVDNLCCVLQANSAVAGLFKISGQDALNTLGESGLLNEVKSDKTSLLKVMEKLLEQTKAMKAALKAKDYDEADTSARLIHRSAATLESKTESYANCLIKACRYYPGEHGQLTLFSRLCTLEQQESIDRINRTLHMNGHIEVAVEDADAMIAAVQANDDEAIDAILAKTIESC